MHGRIRLQSNLNKSYLMSYKGIRLTNDKDQLRALVNAVMNIRGP
jgi:hypothetical protein